MKKITVLIVMLLFSGFGYLAAQQTTVASLAGDYQCMSQGMPAILSFEVISDDQVAMTFCPDALAENCVTYIEIYPTVEDGKIMSKGLGDSDPPTDWPDSRFLVESFQGNVRITVSFSDGIDYQFQRQ